MLVGKSSTCGLRQTDGKGEVDNHLIPSKATSFNKTPVTRFFRNGSTGCPDTFYPEARRFFLPLNITWPAWSLWSQLDGSPQPGWLD